MEWYYAQNNQQQGPVSEVEFKGLVTSGIVTDQTLVWRAGMTNWQPYAEVKAGLASVNPAPLPTAVPTAQTQPALQPGAEEVVCGECGRIHPKAQALQFGEVWVCAGCKPVHVQKLKEGVLPVWQGQPASLRYAGFWIRFAAKLVDLLIMGVVIGVPFMALMFSRLTQVRSGGASDPTEMLGFQVLLQFLAIAFAVGFNTLFIGKYGATPGKMLVGIKVIMTDGSAPTYMRAFGRAWGEQLSGLVCDIGYIIAAFDEQKRALHDHICDTRVVFK